ncbi:c-type cytochrome [Phenylobacterium sp.]|jgi:cytochrome c2|uniref:c-type cytochrome n=1 Tax=Phenylobacterium sp. TaxID=1871053 RepID=UPI002E303BFD|nr:c-type cytochrome [Phenylobacterium sp.]HEX3365687.1 c-type cytochrome [Phenylobacterium sp.]
MSPRLRGPVVAVLLAAIAFAGCAQPSHRTAAQLGGDPERGAVLMVREACGACHVIPGIQEAHGEVGPPLTGFARRTMIAGLLPNTPPNLARWILTPQAIVPGNAMPDIELSPREAADMAAYLETLN